LGNWPEKVFPGKKFPPKRTFVKKKFGIGIAKREKFLFVRKNPERQRISRHEIPARNFPGIDTFGWQRKSLSLRKEVFSFVQRTILTQG